MNAALDETKIATPDLAAPATAQSQSDMTQAATDQAAQPSARAQDEARMEGDGERLAPLFTPETADDFRARWDSVQISFVDDPCRAVRQADELVGQVMKSLSETFSSEHERFEAQMKQEDGASTENMRMALRRYRSFFQRLLAL